MFSTLLEGHRIGSRSGAGTAFSLFAHVAVVVSVVIATQREVNAGSEPPRTPEDVLPVWRPEAPPVAAPVAAPARVETIPPVKGIEILVAPLVIPDVLPAIDFAQTPTDATDRPMRIGRADGSVDGAQHSTSLVSESRVLDWRQVEKQAVQVQGVGVPVYPELLKDAGVSGQVVVSFVVDTAGRAELGTVLVLRSTRPEFTKAVRDAIPRLRFLPAESGRRRVRQLVELPFHFTVR